MQYLLIVLLFLVAEVLGTLAGFGSSAFFVAAGQFVLGFKTVLVFTALQHVFGNFAKIWAFRRDLNWHVALQIGIPSLLATLVGAELSKTVDASLASLVLGVSLVAIPAIFLWKSDLQLPQNLFYSIFGGALAGFLAGLVGTGGAVRGLVLAAFALPKNMFVATSALIDAGVDISRAVIYLRAGYLEKQHFWFVPVLLVVAVAGTWLGKMILDKIEQEQFRRLVLWLLISTGILLIFNNLDVVL